MLQVVSLGAGPSFFGRQGSSQFDWMRTEKLKRDQQVAESSPQGSHTVRSTGTACSATFATRCDWLRSLLKTQWVKLCRKKWFGPLDGNTKFTQEDFDAVMGHSTAVTDAAGSVFAAELIEAYPDAKVVLNYRKDLDGWHRSASKTLASVKHNWALWILSFLSRHGFWAWHVYLDFMWSGIFRGLDNDIEMGVARNGKWVYKEHCNMIRGLVPKERLLEWTVEDGWGPLCEFLGKPVPDEPFPHTNAASGWDNHEDKIAKMYMLEALQTLVALSAVAAVAGALVYKFIL